MKGPNHVLVTRSGLDGGIYSLNSYTSKDETVALLTKKVRKNKLKK